MNLKTVYFNFMFIFGSSVLAMYVYHSILGSGTIDVSTITALFVFSILCLLLGIVFQSKKELTKRQMFFRSSIHFLAVLAIILTVAFIMGWISFSEPVGIVVITVLVTVTYVAVSAVGLSKSKKLADNLNKKLEERYKS